MPGSPTRWWQAVGSAAGAAVALLIMMLVGVGLLAWSEGGVGGLVLVSVAALAVLTGRRASRVVAAQAPDRAQQVLEGVSNAVIVIDPEGWIEEANPAAGALFGYEEGALEGQNISVLMAPELGADHARHTRAFQGTQKKMAGRRELIAYRQDGSEIEVEVFVSAVSLGGSRRIVGVVNDITERRREEAKLEAAIANLKRANAELDEFAYVASHDLKAPLRVIDNASQWLAEDLAPHLTDDTRESLDMLRGRVQRMEQLLNALLEHSRIGREAGDPAMIRGDRLAAELLASIRVPDGFLVTFTEAFQGHVFPSRPFAVILRNLIENGISHHDSTEGRISVSLDPGADSFTVTVSDDGPGVPEKYRRKVFEVFQSLTRRDEVEAVGMGLAIVRKHVEVAGGSVAIEGDEERGTTVRVVWPMTATEEAPLHLAKSA